MADYAEVGAFAISLAHALTRLRNAVDNNEPLTLTAEEAKSLVEAMRMMEVKER